LARAHISILSRDEAKLIHEASLRVPEQVGVKILSPSVRSLLAEHRATVDGEVVRIPGSMVEEALRKAPRTMVLAARDPKLDLELPTRRDYPYAAPSGVADMARFYGLPCYALAVSMDVRLRDWDDLLIRSCRMALMQLMHTDVTAGLGSLEEAEYVALERSSSTWRPGG